MVNKMVNNSQNKVQKLCYIKKVGDTDYFDEEENVKNRDVHLQEPITWSIQLPCVRATAFSQVGLFLDL